MILFEKNEDYYENEIKEANKRTLLQQKKMLSMGLSIEQLFEATGLPLDDDVQPNHRRSVLKP